MKCQQKLDSQGKETTFHRLKGPAINDHLVMRELMGGPPSYRCIHKSLRVASGQKRVGILSHSTVLL